MKLVPSPAAAAAGEGEGLPALLQTSILLGIECFTVHVMFLDESGDHSLDKIDPQFPMFALAGCIFRKAYHDGAVSEQLSQYKMNLFGRDDIILHTADITRNRKGFEQMKDPLFRNQFYSATNALVEGLDFTLIACAINKQKLVNLYGGLAVNPYSLSLECLVERFVSFLQEVGSTGSIVAESRGPIFDRELDLVYQMLTNSGTRFVRPSRLTERLTGLSFRLKQENIPGLQVADLAATPIARAVLGKQTFDDYRVLKRKFRTLEGSYIGAGLVKIPK